MYRTNKIEAMAITGAADAAKLAPNVMAWINRLAGVTLIGFAVYALSGVNFHSLP